MARLLWSTLYNVIQLNDFKRENNRYNYVHFIIISASYTVHGMEALVQIKYE